MCCWIRLGALAAFCVAGLAACQVRNNQPVTVSQRLQDLKRLPPKPTEHRP
jgi:hypothetical protein